MDWLQIACHIVQGLLSLLFIRDNIRLYRELHEERQRVLTLSKRLEEILIEGLDYKDFEIGRSIKRMRKKAEKTDARFKVITGGRGV